MGNARNIAFWVVLFLLILALFNLFNGGQTAADSRTIPYSDFIERVEAGDVSKVTLDGENIIIQSGSERYTTIKPTGVDVTPVLLENKVARVFYTAGVYAPGAPAKYGSDYQSSYLSWWLEFIGVSEIRDVRFQPSLLTGDPLGDQKAAIERSVELVSQYRLLPRRPLGLRGSFTKSGPAVARPMTEPRPRIAGSIA